VGDRGRFLVFGDAWLADLGSPIKTAALFLWLIAVIAWCAFGAVEEADHLAELLGEPLGTLVLTLSIVIIEVALISAVMLAAQAAPTLGRDTMLAVLMIVLNGVVGLALLLGGLRHHACRRCRRSSSRCSRSSSTASSWRFRRSATGTSSSSRGSPDASSKRPRA
jgi:Ca2+/H+ antiporter